MSVLKVRWNVSFITNIPVDIENSNTDVTLPPDFLNA